MMFGDSQNLIIEGGTFTNIGGDLNHYHIQGNLSCGDGELGLRSLGQVASLGAIHDSSERYPPPSCHVETRLEVRRLMLDWAENPKTTSLILWLYGSAGVGKSAIMQSIAEQLVSREGSLGASFFFSAGKPDRNQGKYLFYTIAYQLALSIPELRTHINTAMLCNPTLHTKAINVQIRHLIIEPCRKIAASLQIVPTVLIDGLDECKDHEIQRLIITLIGEALVTYKLPLRFIIASRPEAHIREAFDTTQLCTIAHRILLDQSFQASRDIKKYLEHGFREIYDKNPQVMAQVQKPWPDLGVVDLLVQKASGQFIYAATVLKFVGAEYYRPTSQLAIVLQPRPSSVKPFADLDHLYHQILSLHNDPDALVRVLGTLLTLRGCQPPEVIEDILSMEAGDLSLILRGLHSVINFPQSHVDSFEGDGLSDEERGLRLFHASFRDYLVDRDRSGAFFVDEARFRVEVAFLAFEIVGKAISLSWRGESHQYLRARTWGYLRGNLAFHFQHCSLEHRHRIVDVLHSHIEGFWNFDAIPQISLAPLHCAMSFIEHIIRVHRKLENNRRFPYSYINDCDLADRLHGTECLNDIDKALDQKFIDTFNKFRPIIDRCYYLMLSTSPEPSDFIRSVPGFIAIVHPLPTSDMADILNVDADLLQSYLERNQCFMFSRRFGSALNWHFVDYLCDQNRSGDQYHDRRPDCISLCIRGLSLSFRNRWSHLERCKETTQRYFNSNFAELLNAINISPMDPADHPLWTFVDYLDQIIFYHPGLQDSIFGPLKHIWFYTSKILIWVQKQQQLIKELHTSLHTKFEQKLDNIVDTICQQILYVESTPEGPSATLCPVFLAAIKHDIIEHTRFRQKSDPVPFKIPALNKATDTTGPLMLSPDILLLEAINPSLEQYLTCPTRARGMYISKDCFHTQLAEMWLDQLLDETGDSGKTPVEMSIRLMAGNHCEPHLMRANGTEKIFARLRVLQSWSFIGFSTPHKNSFHHIIIWLESLDKPPLDIYLKYQLMLLKAEGDEIERENAYKEHTIPRGFFDVQEAEPKAGPVPYATSNPTLPIGNYSLKRVLEGVGHLYFHVALVLFHYFHLVFYWHRRYIM